MNETPRDPQQPFGQDGDAQHSDALAANDPAPRDPATGDAALRGSPVLPEEAEVAHARCLVDEDRTEDALTATASLATERPPWKREASYLGALATVRAPDVPALPEPLEPSAFMQAMIAEEAEHAAFMERVDERR